MVRGHLRGKDRKMTALKFSGNNWVVDTNKVPNFDVVWTALQSRSRPNLLQVSQYGYIKLTFRISKPYTNARRHTGDAGNVSGNNWVLREYSSTKYEYYY